MKQRLIRVKPSDPIRTEHINQLIDAYEALLRMLQPGPGLARAADGKLYIKRGNNSSGSSCYEVSGTPKTLAQTQGAQDTDTYDRETDNVPVQFEVITDIKYDPTTYKLTYRTRTIVATGIVSVSAESALVEITTAEDCT